jgi:hypothetical protein
MGELFLAEAGGSKIFAEEVKQNIVVSSSILRSSAYTPPSAWLEFFSRIF